MLPETLIGSYKRYKEDTDVFTTWLSQTAITCGYNSVDLTRQSVTSQKAVPRHVSHAASIQPKDTASGSPKVTASKRKEPVGRIPHKSVPVTKRMVTTKDLIRQAEVIAESRTPKVQMPENIRLVVEHAIRARERCAAWFQQTNLHVNNSLDGHTHFIEVLKESLAILRPCYANCNDYPEGASPDHLFPLKHAEASKGVDLSTDQTSNRFAKLHIEDLDDILDVGLSKEVVAVTKDVTYDIYELEMEAVVDEAFDVFCLFEDLHRIQDFVKQTWMQYNDRKLDLLTASFTTNAAIELVRQASEEIRSVNQELQSKPISWAKATREILGMEDDAGGRYKDLTDSHQFTYWPTAHTLEIFAISVRIGYPQPVLRVLPVDLGQALKAEETKLWMEEQEVLSQLQRDLYFFDTCTGILTKAGLSHDPPVEDEASKGFRQLREGGELSVWIVFAARVLLDIRVILGDHLNRGYQESLEIASNADKLLAIDAHAQAADRWPGHLKDVPIQTRQTIKFWVSNYFPAQKKRHIDEYGPASGKKWLNSDLAAKYWKVVLGLESPEEIAAHTEYQIPLNMEPEFAYSHNPLYCGLVAYNIVLRMERAGLTLASFHQSIYIAAHLYNGLRQRDVIKDRWREMDTVIEQHQGTIFMGKLPVTSKECSSQLLLKLGFSARNWASDKKVGGVKSNRYIGGPTLVSNKTSDLLRRYFDKADSTERCLHQLKTLIEENQEPSMSTKVSRIQLTPLEFLARVRDWLPREGQTTGINYIHLNRTCIMLLKCLRRKMHQRLGKLYPEPHDWDSQRDYSTMVLAVFGEVQKESYECCKSETGCSIEHATKLHVARDVIQTFLNTQKLVDLKAQR